MLSKRGDGIGGFLGVDNFNISILHISYVCDLFFFFFGGDFLAFRFIL